MTSYFGCTAPDIERKAPMSFTTKMEILGIKKNFFYHTTPFLSDDSEDDDDEELGWDTIDVGWKDWNDYSDKCVTVTPVVSTQCLPSIFLFCGEALFNCPSIRGKCSGVRTIEEGKMKNDLSTTAHVSFYEDAYPLPCNSSYGEDDSVGSSDSEERNLKTMARLHSREPLPKSEDDALYGDTPPKCPSRVRFADQPHRIYYDQVTEFEPDVFNFSAALYEKLRKQYAKNSESQSNGCSGYEGVNLNDDDDFEDISVNALTETPTYTDCELRWYCNQQYTNLEPLKVSS